MHNLIRPADRATRALLADIARQRAATYNALGLAAPSPDAALAHFDSADCLLADAQRMEEIND